MTPAAVALTLLWGAAFPKAAVADENPDGLDATVRRYFYSPQTTFVARIDLTQMTQDMLNRAIRGMFYDNTWQQLGGLLDAPAKHSEKILQAASTLVTFHFNTATLIALDNGAKWYGLVPLGKNVDDTTFAGYQLALGAYGYDLDRIGDFGVVHAPRLKLPEKTNYDAAIERACLNGLNQARNTATIGWVVPPTDLVRGQLAKSESDLKKSSTATMSNLLSDVTYVGGYVVFGSQPELHFYIRCANEGKAAAFKEEVDRSKAASIAEAEAKDAETAEQIRAGKYHADAGVLVMKAPTIRRMQEAFKVKAFGPVILLPLYTSDLREITTAAFDLITGIDHQLPRSK
jgi:hypothetical protein